MSVLVERNVECILRDGVTLRANVYRPSEGGRYPVLLSRMPYGKDTNMVYSVLDPVRISDAGYVVIVQDVRGRFVSGGQYQGFPQEFNDGYDTIEWAANLPYSNGDVGMFGASYFAFTQWAAAATGHPALKTLSAAVSFDDARDALIRDGAIEWGTTVSWYLGAIALVELARYKGKTPEFPQDFARTIQDYDHLANKGYHELPLSAFSPLRTHGMFDDFFEQLERKPTHPAWREVAARSRSTHTPVSAFIMGGWYDIFLKYTLESFTRLRALGRDVRLRIGPWTHTGWGSSIGELDFGMAASSTLLDYQYDTTALQQRWFDAQLKGKDTGLSNEPRVKIFVMGDNQWKSVDEWPLPEIVYTPFYIHSGGRANSVAGDGVLSTELPAGQPADSYTYNPEDPVPTIGGNLLMTPSYPPGPRRQNSLEQREDVLVYTSDPLTEDIEVTGPVQAKLWVSTTARDTDFVVRLVDVHRDGSAFNIADGILRMRYRHGLDGEELLTPGDVYAVEVDCWATSNVFKKGHRIRVHVTSSSFPRWSRNLNTGESNETTSIFVSAQQTVYHDNVRPSHILLPVIPR